MSARLSVIDEMFLRTHRGLGTPIVMQGLWRTDERVEDSTLESLRTALARGALGVRVVRARIPGARPRFERSTTAFPVEYSKIDSAEVTAWADEQGSLQVNPERGPGWRLTCARLADGGTVLSLVCSHVIADARGLSEAIAAVLQETTAAALQETTAAALQDSTAAGLQDATAAALQGTAEPGGGSSARSTTADLRDAAQLTRRVAVGTARAVAGLLVSRRRRAELRRYMKERGKTHPEMESSSRPSGNSPVSAVLEVDAEQWDTAAEQAGGTANSLFLSVVAESARRVGESRPLTLSVPMDLRSRDDCDATANSVAMVEITTFPQDSVADLRAASRAAFSSPSMTSPAGFPEEMLQLVPDRVAYALTGNPGERDVLCSNIGPLPDVLSSIGGHRTTGIATRAVHPGVVTGRTRMSAYLSRFGGVYTLALESLDSPNRAALRDQVERVLVRHGLTTRSW
ncbi:hypothetical protein [Rhodococcus sp. NPDC049939]|uniref:hypothetical protein n=1 Tax=Rhodococcus sp. NPDC049939 TaxID=3155511 RepID=UPI0033E65829